MIKDLKRAAVKKAHLTIRVDRTKPNTTAIGEIDQGISFTIAQNSLLMKMITPLRQVMTTIPRAAASNTAKDIIIDNIGKRPKDKTTAITRKRFSIRIVFATVANITNAPILSKRKAAKSLERITIQIAKASLRSTNTRKVSKQLIDKSLP